MPSLGLLIVEVVKSLPPVPFSSGWDLGWGGGAGALPKGSLRREGSTETQTQLAPEKGWLFCFVSFICH